MILSLTMELKAPFYTDQDDTLHMMEPTKNDVPWADEGCAHETTVCANCLTEWRNDYNVLSLSLMTEDGIQVYDVSALNQFLNDEGELE